VKTIFPPFLLLQFCLQLLGGDIKLAWDANPPNENVTNYVVYAFTNSPGTVTLGFTNVALVAKLDVGTNTTATVSDLQPGEWMFSASAMTHNRLESDLAPLITAKLPHKPKVFKFVIVEYSDVLTNFYDVGVFKLRTP